MVEENRLFTSDSPGFGRELETLQQHLDSLSSTPLPPDSYLNKSQGLTFSMDQNNCFTQNGVLEHSHDSVNVKDVCTDNEGTTF